MGGRSIKVKVIKETSKSVTVEIVSLNRKMPVPKATFEERVENGEYTVLNPEVLKANQED
ncbi:MAG: hypothetical protein AAGJ18_19180 [Bacteroidota bacterium]